MNSSCPGWEHHQTVTGPAAGHALLDRALQLLRQVYDDPTQAHRTVSLVTTTDADSENVTKARTSEESLWCEQTRQLLQQGARHG